MSLHISIIGGTAIDEDEVTPLKEGDVATTANIENKSPVNTQTYANHESPVFSNMHLSTTKALILALLKGDVQPNEVKRMISYGIILKSGTNLVALYKLVAEINGTS